MLHELQKSLENTPWVILLIGPPLSGKTTFIRRHFGELDYDLISRDQIVMDLHGSSDYNSAFKSVNQREADKILSNNFMESASSKRNVIVDMTNMTRRRREQSLSYFNKDYYKIALIFPVLSKDEYIERDKKRSEEEKKTIPMSVVNSMISSYQTISKDEGFHKVISI